MKITLNIDYRTNWGESLYVSGNCEALGNDQRDKAMRMTLNGSEHWSLEVDVPDTAEEFEYRYEVRHDNGYTKYEWGAPHRFVAGNVRLYHVYDRWQDQPWDKPYYSSAFTECVCKRDNRAKQQLPHAGCLTIVVAAPMIAPNCRLAISGSTPSLGQWDPAKAVVLSDASYPCWSATVKSADITADTQYKFLILNADGSVVA